jgi:hypothetical protein
MRRSDHKEKIMPNATTTFANEEDVRRSYVEGPDWRKYDGLRVTPSTRTGGPVFLALNGELRYIPDGNTYLDLFINWTGVSVNDYLIDNMPYGPQITSGAILAVATGTVEKYLITNDKKHWIPNMSVFDKFYFNNAKVKEVPKIILDYVPKGEDVG